MEITKEVYIDEIGKNVALNTSKKKLRKKFYCPEAVQLYLDICSLIIGYILYFLVKFESGWFYNPSKGDFTYRAIAMLVLLTYWLIIFWFSGLMKNWYIRSPFDELFNLIRITFFGSCIWFLLVFFNSTRSSLMR